MRSAQRGLFLAILLLALSSCVAVDRQSLPWEFTAPRAEGYAIDLVDVKPEPGTPLVAGDAVDFVAQVKYSLSIASHGAIVLVFENENDRSLEPKPPFVYHRVDSPGGEVSLREKITVPTGTKELHLFIPLLPDGLVRTTGEVTIRYPIRHK
jgi:hypothetical protein